MLLPKAFGCVGKNKQAQACLFLFLGALGALILLFGLTKSDAQIFYVIGAALLLLTAFYFNLIYFIALEMILLAGHSSILLGLGSTLPIFLPILLSVQLLVYYLLSGQLNSFYTLIGISGIALLSIGFSYANPWIFFFGSLFVSIFAFHMVYCGKKIALLWGILNFIFAIASLLLLLNPCLGVHLG